MTTPSMQPTSSASSADLGALNKMPEHLLAIGKKWADYAQADGDNNDIAFAVLSAIQEAAAIVPPVVQAPIAYAEQPFPAPAVQSGELPAPRRYFHTLPLGTAFSYIGSDEKWIVLETHGCGLVAKYAHHDSSKPLQQICSFEDSEYAAQHTEVDVVPLEAIAQTAPAVQSPNKANTVESLTDLYLSLTDAMEYNSGKNGMEWSAEEWAAHLVAHYKATSNAAPIVATVPSELPELPKPWGYARNVDGRIQLSVGADKPSCNERGSGYFTPWAAMFDGIQLQEFARLAIASYAAPSPTEQASDVRNAALEEAAAACDHRSEEMAWASSIRQGEAINCAKLIRAIKSATPADKGNEPAEAKS